VHLHGSAGAFASTELPGLYRSLGGASSFRHVAKALDVAEAIHVYSLVRRYIKTAIVFLALGIALGGWMLLRRELRGVFPTQYETSAHTHLIFVGFVMEMICGVALWLFPRPRKDDARYSPRVAETAYWLLTVGTAIRAASELVRESVIGSATRWVVIGAGLAQIGGIALFFYTMWSRIRAVGSQARETAGERF
jgi:heme/copper-type cytochrome/quinol oxidase subunit 1